MAALARDESVDPQRYYFRTFMRFETSDPQSAWLNRILALRIGLQNAIFDEYLGLIEARIEAAREAEVVVITVPFAAQAETLPALALGREAAP